MQPNLIVNINNVPFQLVSGLFTKGRSSGNTLQAIANGGECIATIRGEIERLNGYRYNWDVVVTTNYQFNTHVLWTGKLQNVFQSNDPINRNILKIRAVDLFGRLPSNKYNTFTYLSSNTDTGSVINILLNNIGLPLNRRNIEEGEIIINHGAMNGMLGQARNLSNVYRAMALVSRTESIGFAYMDRLNNLRYENRSSRTKRLLDSADIVSFSGEKNKLLTQVSMQTQNISESEIWNRFSSNLVQYEAQKLQLVYKTSSSFRQTVLNGDKYNHVGYSNRLNENDTQFILNWGLLKFNAKYSNGARVKEGEGLTVDASEHDPSRFIAKFTNNTGRDIILTRIEREGINQLRHTPQPYGVLGENIQSIGDYDDVKEYLIDTNLIANREDVQDIVNELVSVYSVPTPILKMRVLANESDVHMNGMLNSPIGSLVRVHDSSMGLTDLGTGTMGRLMYVEFEQHDVQFNTHYVTYVLSDGEGLRPFLLPGFSKFGITSRLAS